MVAAWGEGRGRLYNRIVSSNRAAPTAAPTRMRYEGSVGLRGGKGAASKAEETLRRVQASAPTFRLLFFVFADWVRPQICSNSSPCILSVS